jgi:hypothetical protein
MNNLLCILMNFAISFLQLILVLALEVLIVLNALRVFMVSVLNVSRGPSLVVRF